LRKVSANLKFYTVRIQVPTKHSVHVNHACDDFSRSKDVERRNLALVIFEHNFKDDSNNAILDGY